MRSCVSILALGLAISPAQGLTPAAQTFAVEVSTTGMHPSGTQWDGSRIYYLPVELSTASPPDMDLCIVQDEIVCLGQAETGWRPVCPDAERCRFKGAVIDPNRSVGLIVFDHDRFGEDTTAAMSESMNAWGRSATGAAEKMQSDSPFSWSRDLAASAGRMLGEAGSGLADLNGRRLEWMEALILTPPEGEIPGARSMLEARMREFVRSVSPPSPFGGHERRLSGPIPVQGMDGCLWPSPPCQLTYVAINLELEESSDD